MLEMRRVKLRQSRSTIRPRSEELGLALVEMTGPGALFFFGRMG